ncbi:MAG: hypothetical protein HC837_11895 [Chloroflexaceae bacterium]|nr:hypothetical protein [Chloroflexaceae bacterium]
MSLYNPEGIPPVVANTVARVERQLPYPGDILVRVGTRVEPEDTIARMFVPSDPSIINVAQSLSIAPSEVPAAMAYEVGDNVDTYHPLAQQGWRRCMSPVKGVVAAVDPGTGYVTIVPDPVTTELVAALRGVVMEVQPYRSVIIETPAAQIYGVVGVGSERGGVLRLMVIDPEEEVQAAQIDIRSAFAILIGGASITAEALQKAVEAQVRGVIVGSIDEREFRRWLGWKQMDAWQTGVGSWNLPHPNNQRDPGLTLMVTDGFGVRPMSRPVFELLSRHDGQEVVIDGTTRLQQPGHRPRLIIPMARGSSGQLQPPETVMQPGVMVRLLDTEHLGQVAQVRSVSSVPRRLPSGIRTPAVELVQADNSPFWLPQTAVEVVA